MGVAFEKNLISNFSINGRQVKGFRVNSGGNLPLQELNLKWCPQSEPVCGLGDGSTKMEKIIFHLFNFVDFFGGRNSTEQYKDNSHRINHVDLSCNQQFPVLN